MSLEVANNIGFREIAKPEQKKADIGIKEQIPNINLTEKLEMDPVLGGNPNLEKKNSPDAEKQLISEMSKANEKLKFTGTRCEFTYYAEIDRVAIKVIDKMSGKVIREIPPEETLELVQKLWMFAGLLYDEKG